MYGKAFREVYVILENLDKQYTNKISKEFINYVLDNMDYTHEFKYDNTKTIEQQEIQKETSIILTMLYLKYFATENEKIELIKEMKQNDINDEMAKIEKFKTVDIFEKNKVQNNEVNSKVDFGKEILVISNEKWYRKILIKFKNWFNKNKGE